MATSLQISIETYLASSYEPDREYIDGELQERNVGKWQHARVQALLAAWFVQNESRWGVMVSTEQRTRVAGTRVRIPDLVLVPSGPQPSVLTQAPLLVVEVVSPEDNYSDTERRAADYRAMGVETVWILDPETLTGRMCVGDSWRESLRLEVPGTDIHVELPELFRFLQQPRL